MSKATTGATRRTTGKIRIISGAWRGRRLPVPDLPGLRPTSDRLRETLFNWLRQDVIAARCLDLFAGSGALGLEAASRGAKTVLLVEKQAQLAAHLRQQCQHLQATQVQVQQSDALDFLQQPAQRFDVVFLDPPFQQNLLQAAVDLLQNKGWLSAEAKVYVEMAKGTELRLPDNWQLLKQQQSQQVKSCLYLV